VKPNRIQRKIYPTKSAHTSLSPMLDALEKRRREKEAAINKNRKLERKIKNELYLPVRRRLMPV